MSHVELGRLRLAGASVSQKAETDQRIRFAIDGAVISTNRIMQTISNPPEGGFFLLNDLTSTSVSSQDSNDTGTITLDVQLQKRLVGQF